MENLEFKHFMKDYEALDKEKKATMKKNEIKAKTLRQEKNKLYYNKILALKKEDNENEIQPDEAKYVKELIEQESGFKNLYEQL